VFAGLDSLPWGIFGSELRYGAVPPTPNPAWLEGLRVSPNPHKRCIAIVIQRACGASETPDPFIHAGSAVGVGEQDPISGPTVPQSAKARVDADSEDPEERGGGGDRPGEGR